MSCLVLCVCFLAVMHCACEDAETGKFQHIDFELTVYYDEACTTEIEPEKVTAYVIEFQASLSPSQDVIAAAKAEYSRWPIVIGCAMSSTGANITLSMIQETENPSSCPSEEQLSEVLNQCRYSGLAILGGSDPRPVFEKNSKAECKIVASSDCQTLTPGTASAARTVTFCAAVLILISQSFVWG
eukprot:gnl/TRDRNA2_/TRDRNA2_208338_c0_seq1.p1 gnl/TRDRNA2_/TRDRNA2_208338_c0~~gnl/TRDRNA2_/TRDRNA2_208338_c0_seq1.p1  ORF type:complete len:185 (+),score=12.20 gnl/TRDRNA2_/TRDRNA2_208338_c0_seq1:86-640(+)